MRALPGFDSRHPKEDGPRTHSDALEEQRRRILRATAELISKRGYNDTTTELIVRRAKIGWTTFYKNFSDREDCVSALLDDAADRVDVVLDEACARAGDSWPDRVAASLEALFALITSDRHVYRAALVESLSAGPAAQQRYRRIVDRLAALLREGRACAPAGAELPPTLDTTLAGGILWVAYERLIEGEAERLVLLIPETLEFALNPYLGEERAAVFARRLAAAGRPVAG